MILPGQVLHRSNSSNFFLNLTEGLSVLSTVLLRKTTYQLLLIALFHELISVQDVAHLHAPVTYLSYH